MKRVFNVIRYLAVLSATVVTWAALGMVYLERFPGPTAGLEQLLLPWKESEALPERATVEMRIALMRHQMNASRRVANYSFLGMGISFALFCVYVTLVYQQKQRRVRENELLVLKNREIARRNEFISYISATIGHEFKNNLGRIKRRIDLIADIPGEARERVDENMHKLFADIDIFKKISDEREASLSAFTSIDLRELLSGLASQYSDLAEFSLQGMMGPSVITASDTLLRTVFENLIDNSIKYRKPEQLRARIFISSSLDIDGSRRYISLSFRDEGVGMDEQAADGCFYKGKGTDKGWGQGLYFVKYVIGLHAGKIRVGRDYTAPGVGTEIIIKLPFVEETIGV
jgi:signal transduction histidine kinase